jgi:hypothetical protein
LSLLKLWCEQYFNSRSFLVLLMNSCLVFCAQKLNLIILMNPMELITCLAYILHGAAMASNKSSSCQGTECQCCCGNVFYQRVPVFLQDTRRYADEESDARYRMPAASSTDAHASKRRSAEEEESAALKAKKLQEQEIEDQRLVRPSSRGTIPFTSLISTFA